MLDTLDGHSVKLPDIVPANMWQRLFALLVDSILIYGLLYMVRIFMRFPRLRYEEILSIDTAITIGAAVLYFSLMEFSSYQATLGKLALGIKVTDEERNEIGYGKLLLRAFIKTVSILTGIVALLMFIISFSDPKRQGWHDKAAKTLVVRASR